MKVYIVSAFNVVKGVYHSLQAAEELADRIPAAQIEEKDYPD